MKLKRFVGKDVNEAWLKAKMEMGSEAVILNTRKVRKKGIVGYFSKPVIEVLVGKEDVPKQVPSATPATARNLQETDRRGALSAGINLVEKEEKISELENKVSNMENILSKVYEELCATSARKNPSVNDGKKLDSEPENAQKLRSVPNPAPVQKHFYQNLLNHEIDSEIVAKMIQSVEQKVGQNANFNDVASVLFNLIRDMLGKPEAIKLREDGKPTVVLFIGPTGVGKTTTLAKIGANFTLNFKKKVGFITADTYRIAAVDQLRTYADIMGIPVNVVYNANEVKDALESLSDRDLILIDTAGRSTKEKEQFEELKVLVSEAKADEIFLVLSSTTSISNCKQIINSFRFIPNYKLIFTKLDESPVTGVILNTRLYTRKNLSYITMGQSVPDDIEIADTEKLTKNLLGSLQK